MGPVRGAYPHPSYTRSLRDQAPLPSPQGEGEDNAHLIPDLRRQPDQELRPLGKPHDLDRAAEEPEPLADLLDPQGENPA